ncbi:MAG TPA: type 4a pilus biogenesis protein PilO [Candidatus Acidoferrum sp.]|nr:type 4a pilus biogenesis protein PilO [Candidatus Acidoferrum sp.]
MSRDFTWRKRLILGAVVLLVFADVVLAVYSWQLAAAPHEPQKVIAVETKRRDLLRADIKRAQEIRDNVPATQKDCDRFEHSLFPASAGYSAVRSELGETARKSGIQIEDLSFKQTEISNRGMTEVAIDATVNGNYKNVIGFLNGLQRSENLYSVDSLNLATENTNQAASNIIKVSLHVRTYFRTAA